MVNCQAILVNFHCSDLISDAVHSLPSDPWLRIDVVDNSASPEEAAKLAAQLPTAVHLVVSEHNLGFARACDLAFAAADTEFVLLLNPDARLMPGALQRLLTTLAAHPEAAAVSPRVFWDAERQFLMPLSTFPSSAWYFRSQIGRHIHWLLNQSALSQRSVALAAWQASAPFRVEALSGGHILLRRRAVVDAGGLFDPTFFMYWEDSDLIWRLRECGFTLLQDPVAEAVHLYTHSPAKEAMIGKGWANFERKYFHGWFWRLIRKLGGRGRPPSLNNRFEPIAWPGNDNLLIPVPEILQDDWLLEISPAPDFTPAIGYLNRGKWVNIPSELLLRFAGCTLFLRLGAAVSGMNQPQYSFLLTVPEFHAEEF